MLFNSLEYIFIFLPIVISIFIFLTRRKYVFISKLLLITASLFFYSWWNYNYLPLIIFSLFFNYSVGNYLCNKGDSKDVSRIVLSFGIFVNLLLLGYFKYADFLIYNTNIIFGYDYSLLNIVLPLAISFFTFQQIAYLVDSYKTRNAKYTIIDYSIFVTFFPQLIAGPIVSHKEMLPQILKIGTVRFFNFDNISRGLFIFSIGLFKKVIIADYFSVLVNQGFSNSHSLTFIESWLTSFAYTFQLYFDFSGYSDMAIGAALFFSIKLPVNFNSPYKASNIQEFWRRWHVTLSNFLRDYIYIPLGGNKCSTTKMKINVLITFLLGGLWHGAAWTFIVWGLLHGICIILYHSWKKLGFSLNRVFAVCLLFLFLNITWVFFRAESFSVALNIISSMFGLNGIILPQKLSFICESVSFLHIGNYSPNLSISSVTYFYFFIAFIIIFVFRNSVHFMNHLKSSTRSVVFSSILFFFSIININKVSEFLYFNF